MKLMSIHIVSLLPLNQNTNNIWHIILTMRASWLHYVINDWTLRKSSLLITFWFLAWTNVCMYVCMFVFVFLYMCMCVVVVIVVIVVADLLCYCLYTAHNNNTMHASWPIYICNKWLNSSENCLFVIAVLSYVVLCYVTVVLCYGIILIYYNII